MLPAAILDVQVPEQRSISLTTLQRLGVKHAKFIELAAANQQYESAIITKHSVQFVPTRTAVLRAGVFHCLAVTFKLHAHNTATIAHKHYSSLNGSLFARSWTLRP